MNNLLISTGYTFTGCNTFFFSLKEAGDEALLETKEELTDNPVFEITIYGKENDDLRVTIWSETPGNWNKALVRGYQNQRKTFKQYAEEVEMMGEEIIENLFNERNLNSPDNKLELFTNN